MSDKREIAYCLAMIPIVIVAMPEGRDYLKRTFWSSPSASPAVAPSTETATALGSPMVYPDMTAAQGSVAAAAPQIIIDRSYAEGAMSNVGSSAARDLANNSAALTRTLIEGAMQPVMPGPASREHAPPLGYQPSLVGAPSSPALNFGTSVIVNRAGPGTYSASNGDVYAQAGPAGVVNTRTGDFSPIN